VRRTITGFHVDEEGDWVAELSCLHGQHVRHRPPFLEAPWVQDADGRRSKIGEPLDCPLCDRAELPDGLVVARRTDTWDPDTTPAGLRRDHRVAAGTWGLVEVEEGAVTFVAETQPRLDVVVTPAAPQPIPPEVAHHVAPGPGCRFHVTFLRRP